MTVQQTTQFRTNFDGCKPFSNIGAKFRLAASTEKTFTVPGDATQTFRADFSFAATAEIWVKINGTITAPGADSVAQVYMEELNPKVKYVQGGDVIHVISTGTPQLGISFLATP